MEAQLAFVEAQDAYNQEVLECLHVLSLWVSFSLEAAPPLCQTGRAACTRAGAALAQDQGRYSPPQHFLDSVTGCYYGQQA